MSKLLTQLTLALLPLTLLLGACGAVSVRPAAEITAEFEAAVEETIAARATDTPLPTRTRPPTETPTVTITPTPTETFTPSPIPPTSVVDVYCDNSAFIEDVTIPDGSLLTPGQVFEKTWRLENTGLCNWHQGYTIAWVSGDAMQGVTRPLSQTVAPGEQIDVTVRLTAPFQSGSYSGIWRLLNSKGEPFGAYVSVTITVAASGAPTPTPTP